MELDKTKFRKEITAPFSGQKFIIRRVRLKEFLLSLGGLPVPLSNAVQEALDHLREKTKTGDQETEQKTILFYVSKGVIEPKIWTGEESACPPDAIYYEDLGGDLDYLANEIISFSHELTGLKEYENFFRESGAGITGPDGQEVRRETFEPVADRDAGI